MSFNTDWDIDSYREEHESEEHWRLRRRFMERWKTEYSEDRLVCLARVFANMELLGCRYPTEVMQEIAGLSHEVAQEYRNSRKNMLKRTFVSASAAAEDRAKGTRREGGIVIGPPIKQTRIDFVRSGEVCIDDSKDETSDTEKDAQDNEEITEKKEEKHSSEIVDANNYVDEFKSMKCLSMREFHDSMFETSFGRLVLMVRPWTSKLGNIMASCQACHIQFSSAYANNQFLVTIGGATVAQATGVNKPEARAIAEGLAWDRLKDSTVVVLVKEQWIAQGSTRISVQEVSGRGEGGDFGAPLEDSVAAKMMKLMGWKGGGLGVEAQGIEEPIKPHLQMVNRAGLGSQSSDINQIRKAGRDLMRRYISSDTLDVDLVFSSEFTKEERAALHQLAQRAGLASRSYGDTDRFLVVKKKINPFSLVHAVLEKGGNTPKYEVYLPAGLRSYRR